VTESSREDTAALEALAEALDPGQFAATVTLGTAAPHLRITNRHARQLSENIYAGHGWFWWSWAERIADYGDPAGAAAKVARVLRTVGEPVS
jgi:hypothetical protein